MMISKNALSILKSTKLNKNLLLKFKLNNFTESSKQEVKKTSLHAFHKEQLKAKMVPFAGYDMPVQYFGIIEEHLHCRENASVFDVSHMGQVRIYGKDRFSFIESLCVGDIKDLKTGGAALSLFTNEKGGVIDDTIITNMPDYLNVVLNAGCKDKDLKHIYAKLEERRSIDKDVRVEYIEDRSLIALQGPKAAKVLQNFVGGNLSNLSFMEASLMSIPNIDETVLVSRCGYTGEDGFEISVSDNNATKLFDLLLKNGDVKPCGLGARDTLRLEAGLCLYGHELNEDITPIEASLKWVIGKRRRTEGGFPGYEVIKKQMETDVAVKRVGFIIESGSPAREEALIFDMDKTAQIGKVCSGTFSPCLKKPIGMAYVNSSHSKLGTQLKVVVRNKDNLMKLTKMPFVPSKYYKKKTE